MSARAESEPAEALALTVVRTFEAPRALVFKAWTDPAMFRRWIGPRGFTATHASLDACPGGRWRACLRRDADGEELWQGGVYRDVVAPERLVFTFAWDAASGLPVREMLVSITFAEDQGRTIVTLRHTGFESIASRDGHLSGWSSTLDRLTEILAQGDARP